MRLFLSEFVTSAALADQPLPPSWLREGRAMRDAVAADFARVPEVTVVVTSDPRVEPPAEAESVAVDSPTAEQRAFLRLAGACDATLVIAPELGGELSRRCRLAAEHAARVLNCTPEAIDQCGDKFALAQHLIQHGIPTIPACRLGDLAQRGRELLRRAVADSFPFPVVLKPRWGAGSVATYLCDNPDAVLSHWLDAHDSGSTEEPVLQPFIPGRAFSVAVCCDAGTGSPRQLFPVAEQRLSDDGRFQYLGGEIPACNVDTPALHALVRRTAATLRGLAGYVGFDLLVPDAAPHEPLVVEVNPRLTTSYSGYRKLTSQNLADLLLDRDIPALTWNPQQVTFDAAGTSLSLLPE